MGLDMVELVMEIEREFGIDLPDEEAGRLLTVGMLADFVMRQLPAERRLTEEAVFERVRRIVAHELGARLEDVHRHTRFIEDLNAG